MACLTLLAGLLAGCDGGEVEVSSPALEGPDAAACSKLVDALPESVSDQPSRPVDAAGGYAAAWGDPAIVLRCGVPTPRGFDEFAVCQETNDVGWFVPEEQIEDQAADVVMTTIGFEQNVEVRLPAEYRPPAVAMVDVADAVKGSVRQVRPCL